MRVGLIVDGLSEFSALRALKPQIERDTGHTLLDPTLAAIQPKASILAIAAACITEMRDLRTSRRIDSALILFDRENRPECPGVLADQVRLAIEAKIDVPTHVVVKDVAFENWLVSDLQALRSLPGRFRMTPALNRISPDRADHVDALALLQAAAIRRSYQKVPDSRQILGHADILRMATNSRSFRRFLRCLDHPAYQTQSRRSV